MPVPAPVQGTIVSVAVAAAETVLRGQPLLVMEAMKMEHVVTAPVAGRIAQVQVAPGDTVIEAHPLVFIEEEAGSLVLRLQQWNPGFQPRSDGPNEMRLEAMGESEITFVGAPGAGMKRLTYRRDRDRFVLTVDTGRGPF